MHPDEIRTPEEIRRLRVIESGVESPDETARSADETDRRLRQMQRETEGLQDKLSKIQRHLEQEKGRSRSLAAQLESTTKKIEALRDSKSMKIGRIIGAPYRSVRAPIASMRSRIKVLANYDAVKRRMVFVPGLRRAARSTATKDAATATNAGHSNSKTGNVSAAQKPGTKSKDFTTLLNHAWYQEGSINKSHKLITNAAVDFDVLPEKTRILIKRVKGAYRLSQQNLVIPKRSLGCAYLPEPDRVLYAVHSTPVFNSNGYSTRTRGVAAGMSAAGTDVVVVARSGYPWDSKSDVPKPEEHRYSEDVDGVTYVHTPGGNLSRDGLDHYIQKAADSLVREARMLRPSVIQSASNHKTALPALIAARRVGVPFVYEVRGLWEVTEAAKKPGFADTERFAVMRDLEILTAMEADAVLAITSQVADVLISRGVPEEKISLIPNAVDTNRFLPIPKDVEYAKKLGLNIEVPTIGFAGSLVEYEGLETLLNASRSLSDRGEEHQIAIAGSGTAEADLQKLSGSLSLGNVHFLGRLPQDDIPRLLSALDIVVCPRISNQVTELVSPLKPLESFASGRATVISDVAPNLDLAGESEHRRSAVFNAGNPEALANTLSDLLKSSDLRAELSRRARLWTVRERNWTKVGALIVEQLKEARERYRGNCRTGKSLSALHVVAIADEFTTAALEGSFQVSALDRDRWEDQVNETIPDLIFVESAWAGNSGQWHRGVGYYSDEESHDLRSLLDWGRNHGIPTVFWNKEDPVHFSRFAPNAALFDHVFTTDANMVQKYLKLPGNRIRTASAMPFFAQPKIHNPLPVAMEPKETIAYAGTYYGDRYKERSENLEALLSAAEPFGLDIYDRQASNPDSPYRFPPRYRPMVRGALPYNEVVDSYQAHLAHLNVNSVVDSPTMFSRRVVEIPATGGVVLSAAGRGVSETLGNTIAFSDDPRDYRALLSHWANDSRYRFDEARRQLRTVYRSHIAETALAILCRTIGLNVYVAHWPSYGVKAQTISVKEAEFLAAQSLRPTAVSTSTISDAAQRILESAAVRVCQAVDHIDVDYLATIPSMDSRTYFEDLLVACKFGKWDYIIPDFESTSPSIARSVKSGGKEASLIRCDRQNAEHAGSGTGVVMAMSAAQGRLGTQQEDETPPELAPGTRVLVAGHDLKFAKGLLREMEARGLEVDIDHWNGHNQHDPKESERKLAWADTVFCEWGLGNAVWYSQNVAAGQRLIVRVHSQELFLPYLKQINHVMVDQYIFVGELIRKTAVISHGVPESWTKVIPNPVETTDLNQEKEVGARFCLGFVGMVPRSKRLDRALDLLERLQREDSRYHLRVKGKQPEDYPWMTNRPEEMTYYEELYRRVEAINSVRAGSVIFDDFGDNMPAWYRKVGVVISVSEFESFHLTVADGMASAALPVILAWPGSDLIYPEDWLDGTQQSCVSRVLNWDGDGERFKSFSEDNFERSKIYSEILKSLTT